jgi:hypothetical protein
MQLGHRSKKGSRESVDLISLDLIYKSLNVYMSSTYFSIRDLLNIGAVLVRPACNLRRQTVVKALDII